VGTFRVHTSASRILTTRQRKKSDAHLKSTIVFEAPSYHEFWTGTIAENQRPGYVRISISQPANSGETISQPIAHSRSQQESKRQPSTKPFQRKNHRRVSPHSGPKKKIFFKTKLPRNPNQQHRHSLPPWTPNSQLSNSKTKRSLI